MLIAALAALTLAIPAAAVGALDAPIWQVPERVTAEATGPSGAIVTYTASATTGGKRPRPLEISCSPRSGSQFRIGQTTVTCRVTDDDEEDYEDERTSFPVVVQDTTAPALSVPAPLELTSADGAAVSASDPRIVAFLNAATATDAVTRTPVVTHNGPAAYPVGGTVVTFRAVDVAGNAATKGVTVTVSYAPSLPPAPPVPPPPDVPADVAPPAAVTQVRAATGAGRVVVTWARPADADFARVEITRTGSRSAPAVVYRGPGTRFVDRSVRNGVVYSYAIQAYDTAGNGTAAVTVSARPRATRLVAPLDGAALIAPPVLRWAHAAGAMYYNVQLWRDGRKVLSRWPVRPSFALTTRWSYGGRRHSLSAGTYTWYVWPGYGPRSAARYGKLLGSRAFEIVVR